MKDQELIELRNKLLLAISISILLVIPLFLIIKNISYLDKSKVIKKMNNNEEFILILRKSKCNECKMLTKNIKKYNYKYMVVYIDTDRNYKDILRNLNLGSNNIEPPTVIYIKDKKVSSYIVNVKEEKEIKSYLKNIE